MINKKNTFQYFTTATYFKGVSLLSLRRQNLLALVNTVNELSGSVRGGEFLD